MLPDFPEVKEFYQKRLNELLTRFMGSHPLLSQMREHSYREGTANSIQRESGEEVSSGMKKLEELLKIDSKDIAEQGPLAFIQPLKNMADSINEKRMEMVLRDIHEATEVTGNVLDTKGEQLSHDHLLQMLEKITIPFDESGNPLMPSMVVNENLMKKLQERIPEWEADPENKRKFEELMQTKKKEWDDRESHRKLVD